MSENLVIIPTYKEKENIEKIIRYVFNLKYGLFYGCVNYTSRALFYSGVLNANALLPITSPLLLEAELAIRQLGIYANPYLIQKY